MSVAEGVVPAMRGVMPPPLPPGEPTSPRYHRYQSRRHTELVKLQESVSAGSSAGLTMSEGAERAATPPQRPSSAFGAPPMDAGGVMYPAPPVDERCGGGVVMSMAASDFSGWGQNSTSWRAAPTGAPPAAMPEAPFASLGPQHPFGPHTVYHQPSPFPLVPHHPHYLAPPYHAPQQPHYYTQPAQPPPQPFPAHAKSAASPDFPRAFSMLSDGTSMASPAPPPVVAPQEYSPRAHMHRMATVEREGRPLMTALAGGDSPKARQSDSPESSSAVSMTAEDMTAIPKCDSALTLGYTVSALSTKPDAGNPPGAVGIARRGSHRRSFLRDRRNSGSRTAPGAGASAFGQHEISESTTKEQASVVSEDFNVSMQSQSFMQRLNSDVLSPHSPPNRTSEDREGVTSPGRRGMVKAVSFERETDPAPSEEPKRPTRGLSENSVASSGVVASSTSSVPLQPDMPPLVPASPTVRKTGGMRQALSLPVQQTHSVGSGPLVSPEEPSQFMALSTPRAMMKLCLVQDGGGSTSSIQGSFAAASTPAGSAHQPIQTSRSASSVSRTGSLSQALFEVAGLGNLEVGCFEALVVDRADRGQAWGDVITAQQHWAYGAPAALPPQSEELIAREQMMCAVDDAFKRFAVEKKELRARLRVMETEAEMASHIETCLSLVGLKVKNAAPDAAMAPRKGSSRNQLLQRRLSTQLRVSPTCNGEKAASSEESPASDIGVAPERQDMRRPKGGCGHVVHADAPLSIPETSPSAASVPSLREAARGEGLSEGPQIAPSLQEQSSSNWSRLLKKTDVVGTPMGKNVSLSHKKGPSSITLPATPPTRSTGSSPGVSPGRGRDLPRPQARSRRRRDATSPGSAAVTPPSVSDGGRPPIQWSSTEAAFSAWSPKLPRNTSQPETSVMCVSSATESECALQAQSEATKQTKPPASPLQKPEATRPAGQKWMQLMAKHMPPKQPSHVFSDVVLQVLQNVQDGQGNSPVSKSPDDDRSLSGFSSAKSMRQLKPQLIRSKSAVRTGQKLALKNPDGTTGSMQFIPVQEVMWAAGENGELVGGIVEEVMHEADGFVVKRKSRAAIFMHETKADVAAPSARRKESKTLKLPPEQYHNVNLAELGADYESVRSEEVDSDEEVEDRPVHLRVTAKPYCTPSSTAFVRPVNLETGRVHDEGHVVPSGLLLEIEILDDAMADEIRGIDLKTGFKIDGTVLTLDGAFTIDLGLLFEDEVKLATYEPVTKTVIVDLAIVGVPCEEMTPFVSVLDQDLSITNHPKAMALEAMALEATHETSLQTLHADTSRQTLQELPSWSLMRTDSRGDSRGVSPGLLGIAARASFSSARSESESGFGRTGSATDTGSHSKLTLNTRIAALDAKDSAKSAPRVPRSPRGSPFSAYSANHNPSRRNALKEEEERLRMQTPPKGTMRRKSSVRSDGTHGDTPLGRPRSVLSQRS